MKKRLLLLLISCISIFAIGTISASAKESYTYEDLTYIIENGEITITDCNPSATTVVIPSEIDGKPVTKIKGGLSYAGTFSYRKSLTSVTIPDSVTYIGERAFASCENLTKVTLSAGLKFVGRNAFDGCNRLVGVYISNLAAYLNCRYAESAAEIAKSNPMYYAKYLYLNGKRVKGDVTIPEGVTQIPCHAFCGQEITSVTIPDSVTFIGMGAFGDCSSLTAVYITDISAWCKIEYGGYSDYATTTQPLACASNLYLNEELVTNLVIPDGVTAIGAYAFDGCGSITSVTIPDSVTSIGACAFVNCDNLTSITIPDSVTSIGAGTFGGCDNLTSITIPNSVTAIEENTFWLCKRLTNITIPDGVTSIGKNAFYLCENLTSITIPASVTFIGKNAFVFCDSLTNINITDIGAWCKIRFLSYPLQRASNLYLNGVLVTDLIIPDGVASIGDYAFSGYSRLSSVNFPDGITTIEEGAFAECSSLNTVNFPESITAIEEYAFRGCSSLNTVNFPDSVTSIGTSAFGGCSNLSSVVIPSGITSIKKMHLASVMRWRRFILSAQKMNGSLL